MLCHTSQWSQERASCNAARGQDHLAGHSFRQYDDRNAIDLQSVNYAKKNGRLSVDYGTGLAVWRTVHSVLRILAGSAGRNRFVRLDDRAIGHLSQVPPAPLTMIIHTAFLAAGRGTQPRGSADTTRPPQPHGTSGPCSPNQRAKAGEALSGADSEHVLLHPCRSILWFS